MCRVGYVAVMEKKVDANVWVLIETVDASGIDCGSTTDGLVVTFGKKQLSRIRAVLSGDPGDKRLLHDSLLQIPRTIHNMVAGFMAVKRILTCDPQILGNIGH